MSSQQLYWSVFNEFPELALFCVAHDPDRSSRNAVERFIQIVENMNIYKKTERDVTCCGSVQFYNVFKLLVEATVVVVFSVQYRECKYSMVHLLIHLGCGLIVCAYKSIACSSSLLR